MTLFPVVQGADPPELAPFQKEAVEWILELVALRGGALLADSAGLGKSWVAAAVAREWEIRGGESEIVVPTSLVAQWRGIAAMFGLSSSIVSHDCSGVGARVIDERPKLVIVDEAHRFRNSRTRRYRNLALRSRRAAVLLVTATPICNSPDDLRALFGVMVADDALADRGVPSLDEAFRARCEEQLRAVVDELSIARDRESLPESLRFANPTSTSVEYSAAGTHEEDLASAFARLRFPLVQPGAAGLLRAFLWRRLESSAAALRGTLERLRRLHARALECATRGVALTRGSYRAAFGDPDAPVFQDILFPQLWGVGGASDDLDAGAIRRELGALDAAIQVVAGGLADDPKVSLVSRVVAGFQRRRGLVFTQSRDTAKALWSSLRTTNRCGLVTGTGCRDAGGLRVPMDEVLAMLSRGALDVVVSTDVGCEGLNLQSATYVVHADLPWNPAKLRQRLGRANRIGQRSASVAEIALVAERSPVASAIRQKSRDAERFAPHHPGNGHISSSARLDLRMLADSRERGCVVDLVERRSGRSGRATRSLDVGGLAGSTREGRDLAYALGAFRSRPAPEGGSLVDRAVASWVELVRTRETQPQRLDATSAQCRLLEAAERAGALTGELVDVLSRRYRAGAEMLIAETLANGVDRRSLAALMIAIGAGVVDREPYDARVAGCLVTERWLRSAARYGKGRP